MSEKVEIKKEGGRRSSPSLFGPVVLITVGIYFLLDNLNMLPPLNWEAALNLWPLGLIFLGLNVIVRQFPRPLGSLLSLLVAMAAIVTLSYILLGGFEALPGRLQLPERTIQREQISEALDERGEAASVEIDFNRFPARLEALESNTDNLIQGEVVHLGEMVFDVRYSTGGVTVLLDSDGNGADTFWEFGNLVGDSQEWTVGLNPAVDMELQLDLSSGTADLDLENLSLSNLKIDGSSGATDLVLPAGAYDVAYNSGSGRVEIWLPAAGRLELDIESGSGRVTFYLPDTVEARIQLLDKGSGSFNPGPRFTQVDQRDGDEGIWETDGYEDAGDRVVILLDTGSGSVQVERLEMTGR